MKHNLKRIIPILLLITVIGSIFWYLFSYDRDFSKDLLLQQARICEKRGEHDLAAWFYNLAYLHSGDSEDVAIELAQQYKEIGNYTKAEYTLSNAIADNGGSVKLYIALCQTYVEQDKLLDAVSMLERVADPQIKAQLDALRPKAPTVSHAPGFYSQYITVSLESDSGSLYVTGNKEYPSTQTDLYQNGIMLSGGENTIYAVVVGEDGLVSPLNIFTYTVGGVIEEVKLKDSRIESIVRQQLGIASPTPLYSNDLWNITELIMPAGVTYYADLVWMPYLKSLTIENGSFINLSDLSTLQQLTSLTIRGSNLSAADIQVIASLPYLQHLTLTDCRLSTIEGLSGSKNLVTLDLSNNMIRDISSLSFMNNLRELNLSHNALTNLSFISALSGLEKLNVSYNSLTSILPLSGCPGLTELDISYNYVENLNGLENLTKLTRFYGSNNSLSDVTLLGACTDLIELDISSNQIINIGALASLNHMTSFHFSNNMVINLPAWNKNCELVYLNGSNNSIQSVTPLAGLANLTTVLVDHNRIPTLNPLTECHNLVRVDAFGNPISDVSKLVEMSIVVNYDPS